jgi:serine/threonine protein phosphatase PrpC
VDIDFGAYTDTGKVREINQDRALATKKLFAVADGMGGHVGGEVAAELALEELVNSFKTDPTGRGLAAAIRGANLAVWTKGMDEPNLRGMGTTLTAGTIIEADGMTTLHISHVGDSRAYILRQEELTQLTYDHTVVEELIRQGKLSQSQAQVDKRRHTLTRALGVEPSVTVDSFDVELERGDAILLCSDGLSNELSENEIVTLLSSPRTAVQIAEDLVRVAKAHGGKDNITAVVVFVDKTAQNISSTAGMLHNSKDTNTAFGPINLVENSEVSLKKDVIDNLELLDSGSVDEATLLDFPVQNIDGGRQKNDSGPSGSQPIATQDSKDKQNISEAPSALSTTVDENKKPKTISENYRLKNRNSLIYDLSDDTEETEVFKTKVPLLTFRTVLFFALFVAIGLSTYGTVKWFSDNSYFVGLDGKQIAIFHGRPNGSYFFKPKLMADTSLTANDVLPEQASALKQGVEVTSLNQAYQLIDLLKTQRIKMGLGGDTTTTTTIPYSQLLTTPT